jgi:hypothetical protein
MANQPVHRAPAPAPRTALAAAELLIAAGEHVHYVTDAQVRCLTAPDPANGCPA